VKHDAPESRIIEKRVTSSTNDDVIALALDGAPDGIWVRADAQTAGRGRRQRAWVSVSGNLYCTGLMRLTPNEGPLPQLSFVAALAVFDAVAHWLDIDRLALKWPNDLLLDGAKVSGVLLETSGVGSGQDRWVAIGVGVNIATHPTDLAYTATSFAAAGLSPVPTANEMLLRLIEGMGRWRAKWQMEGFPVIRAAWLARTRSRGQRVTVRVGDEAITGVFEDLNDDGALILRLETGAVRAIHAGEVFGV
jgi:BirA family transcriptional regulator, biotin operon repressor / biotin---[acetyl-CoA-carboxylase] ligase